MSSNRSYTQPAEGFLVGPPDAPDEVVDVKEYERAMEALENADAAYQALVAAVKALSATADGINNDVVAVGSKELLALEELVGIPAASPEDLE